MEQRLQTFLDFLKKEYSYSDNTIAAYKNDLNQFVKFLHASDFADNAWEDVTEDTVSQYVTFMKNKAYASSSVARKVAAVKSFFNFLASRKFIKSNPAEHVDAPKVKKRLPQTLSSEDIERLLEAPTKKTTPKNLRDTALLTMLYSTGMRVTEIVSLQLKDVVLERSLLYCEGKDGQRRELPFDEETAVILHNYMDDGRPYLLKEREDKALFLNHRGQQLTRQGLWLIIKAYAKQANLSTAVTPHTLRHSFATHKLNNGSNLQEVQKLLGHANISTTQIYAQLTDEEE